ncbi:hypothetical protein EVAR_82152_1 [Eumeta japonica]|uniref:Uncharacterized protein n=1 Tax=Eumeta variegata TaxID=151549 RepID=A0A4C1U203_EUMVA|nr:hypothetical protein EVAR_82152_1 [Eumeta japonica]
MKVETNNYVRASGDVSACSLSVTRAKAECDISRGGLMDTAPLARSSILYAWIMERIYKTNDVVKKKSYEITQFDWTARVDNQNITSEWGPSAVALSSARSSRKEPSRAGNHWTRALALDPEPAPRCVGSTTVVTQRDHVVRYRQLNALLEARDQDKGLIGSRIENRARTRIESGAGTAIANETGVEPSVGREPETTASTGPESGLTAS